MRLEFGALVALAVLAGVLAPAPASAADVVLRPPVSASILDPFRAPAGPYAPGNRGIEYNTAAGDPIAAAGPGLVVFAGPVGGRLHVTIDHGAGLLSSYSFVETMLVRRGTEVSAGQRIAVAGGPFHFGTRIDGSYVNPASLFGVREVSVELVPHPDPAGEVRYLDLVERSERLQYAKWLETEPRSGLGRLLGRIGGLIRDVVVEPFVTVDLVSFHSDLLAAVEALAVLAADADPVSAAVELGLALKIALYPPECTPAGVAPPASATRRIAVVVDGLGSSSDTAGAMAGLDLAALGYAADDIVRAGYRTGANKHGDYTAQDTYGPVSDSAAALLEQLRRLAAATPDAPIDIFAHSLGGVVSAAALAASGDDNLVDLVVTFSTPFRGTPTAELANVVDAVDPVGMLLDAVWPAGPVGTPVLDELDDPSIAISEGFPPSTRVLTFGQRGDVVVPAHLAAVPGHPHVILGTGMPVGAHSTIVSDPAALREIRLVRAGLAPTCEGLLDRVVDVVLPRAIARTAAVAGDVIRVGDAVIPGDDVGAVGEWRR